jgi:hypothetical protein
MRTLLEFQVNHLDCDFYDKHYKPGAVTGNQREHTTAWGHSDMPRQ